MALKHLMVGVAAIGLMATPALGQSQDTTGQQQPPAQAGEQQQLAQEDTEFATKAAEGGLKEVQLGELAQQQAESPEVQQFGQRMVQDHGQANEQLMQIAQEKAIELPQQLPEDAQQLYEELQQKSGQEFDQAYMDEMVSDHEEDVQLFEQYAQSGRDPDLTSFAEQTLPVLQEHLELAQQTQKQVTAAAGQGEQPDAAMQGQQQAATQPEQAVRIDEVLGSRVVNANGEEVAQIEDLVVDQNQTHYAILSVGGFLGHRRQEGGDPARSDAAGRGRELSDVDRDRGAARGDAGVRGRAVPAVPAGGVAAEPERAGAGGPARPGLLSLRCAHQARRAWPRG